MLAAAAPASPGDMGLYLGRQDRQRQKFSRKNYTSEQWHNSSILH